MTVERTRTNIRLAALLAVVALVAAACGGGESDDSVSSRGTTSTTAATASSTTIAVPEADLDADFEPSGGTGDRAEADGNATDTGSSGAPGGSGSGSAGGESTEPASDPAAPQPVAAGLYEYDTDGRSEGPSGSRELPELTTLEAQTPEGARQRSVRDMRDENGEGTVTTIDVLHRDDGVHIEYLKIVDSSSTFGTVTFEFEFDPPELVLPTDPQVGFHTEFSTRSKDGSLDVDVTIDITGEETLTIGGTSVDTLTTETVIVFSGSFDGKATWNDNVDPERFLIVREDRVSDVEVGVSEFHSEYVATLRSLSPE